MSRKLYPEIQNEKERKALVLEEWKLKNPEKGKAACKRYYDSHTEQRKKSAKVWAENNKDRKKDADLRRKYGISLNDYNELFKKQNGKCAICGYKPLGKIRLHVDHDHKTGCVRGLLCYYCNRHLGWLDQHKEAIILYEEQQKKEQPDRTKPVDGGY